MPPKKILLLITQMEAGGAQKAMLQLSRGLSQRGHNVVIASMYEKQNSILRFEKEYGLPIINLKMKKENSKNLNNLFGFFKGLFALYLLMRKERFDIVQTFTHYSNIIGTIIGLFAGVPIRVSSQRNNLISESRVFIFLDRMVANSIIVHKMVSVSENIRTYCIEEEKIRSDKLVTILNGIDVNQFDRQVDTEKMLTLREELGAKRNDLIVTLIGRLHPQKGHKVLISCVNDILMAVPNCRFWIIGEGELKEELQDCIQTLGLQDRVLLLGTRQDVPSLLKVSNLFVLPSLWEGMPNAVLEAMAAGLPVVATTVDGVPEVVIHGRTGLLVPPGNADILKNEIIRLLLDPQMSRSMGKYGRIQVEKFFTVDFYIQGFENLYNDLSNRFYEKEENLLSILERRKLGSASDLMDSPKQGLISFLNPYSYMIARQQKHIFKKFDFIGIDGFLLVKLLGMMNIVHCQRISFDMTCLAPLVFKNAILKGKSIYFIGTRPNLIKKAVERISREFTGLKIIGYRCGYFNSPDERSAVIKSIVKLSPDIVIAGLGTPLQEKFLISLTRSGWQGTGYTCGGFLHQTSRDITYYPKWMDRLNIRWVYRLIDEPKLVKRYFLLYPKAILLLFADWLRYLPKKERHCKQHRRKNDRF